MRIFLDASGAVTQASPSDCPALFQAPAQAVIARAEFRPARVGASATPIACQFDYKLVFRSGWAPPDVHIEVWGQAARVSIPPSVRIEEYPTPPGVSPWQPVMYGCRSNAAGEGAWLVSGMRIESPSVRRRPGLFVFSLTAI